MIEIPPGTALFMLSFTISPSKSHPVLSPWWDGCTLCAAYLDGPYDSDLVVVPGAELPTGEARRKQGRPTCVAAFGDKAVFWPRPDREITGRLYIMAPVGAPPPALARPLQELEEGLASLQSHIAECRRLCKEGTHLSLLTALWGLAERMEALGNSVGELKGDDE